MRALVARWLAVIVMLGLLALVWVTNHTPCAPYGLFAYATNELPVRTRSAARRPSSSPIGVADQGGGIPSDRAREVDPVPSRMLLFCHGHTR